MTDPSPNVSIVVPCKDGAAFIESSLGRLTAFLEAERETLGICEVLLVDDGSSDGTADRVRSRFPEVRILRHERNRGKGAAVRTGMLEAKGRFLFFMDADVPYELDALLSMLDYLDRKEFHIAIGTRHRLPRDHPRERDRIRRFASLVFTAFVSRIVVTGIRDTQCGFKGFQREAGRKLFACSVVDGFGFDVEVLYLAFKCDLDIKRVPVRLAVDEDSSISVFADGIPMLLSILAVPFRYHAGRYELPEIGPGATPRDA